MPKNKKGSLRSRMDPIHSGTTGDTSFLIGKVEDKEKEHFSLDQIESHIDYLSLGILDKKEEEELINLESKIKFHGKKTLEHMLYSSEAIYKGNLIFSNNRNGNFGKWLEELGISRETGNTAIRRYELYMEISNKKVLGLPGRVIKELTGKNRESYDNDEVDLIIESEKPTFALNVLKTKKTEEKLLNEDERKDYLYKLIIAKKASIKKIENEVLKLEEEYKLLLKEN